MRRTAVLLPGRAYPCAAPLLNFLRQGLLEHGYEVRDVAWDQREVEAAMAGGSTPESFVAGHLDAMDLDGVPPGDVLVAGKSLGTRATAYVAQRGWRAVWLTPLLTEASVVQGIRDNAADQLLIGGAADHLWDTEVGRGLRGDHCQVHEIADADHALVVPGDAVRSARIQLEIAETTHTWLERLSE